MKTDKNRKKECGGKDSLEHPKRRSGNVGTQTKVRKIEEQDFAKMESSTAKKNITKGFRKSGVVSEDS